MKKRTVFIGAILSVISLGQPLLVKTGLILSTAGMMLSVPKKVYAESAEFHTTRGNKKSVSGDHYGALSDYNKAIEINPSDATYYTVRGLINQILGDIKLACDDFRKGGYMGDKVGTKAVKRYC